MARRLFAHMLSVLEALITARNRLLERHGHRLVTLDSQRRRAVQVAIGVAATSSGSGGRVIM